ncbi:MAG TPA: L,D-transpeptidase family protein [Anaeromyxobacteraceae bacterium]|nr:L,D-transpeptidase family protein [Anaeromyxobacteraceae bacterium]
MTVVSRKRALWLCQNGAVVAKFQVAIGRRGVDKRKKGDGRTPLGTYALGAPRPSARYGLFIPIHYPTPEQAAKGFTGSDLGIHGPPRGLTEPEYPTTEIDWTQGCIATGMDFDIAIIASFVRDRSPTLVIE